MFSWRSSKPVEKLMGAEKRKVMIEARASSNPAEWTTLKHKQALREEERLKAVKEQAAKESKIPAAPELDRPIDSKYARELGEFLKADLKEAEEIDELIGRYSPVVAKGLKPEPRPEAKTSAKADHSSSKLLLDIFKNIHLSFSMYQGGLARDQIVRNSDRESRRAEFAEQHKTLVSAKQEKLAEINAIRELRKAAYFAKKAAPVFGPAPLVTAEEETKAVEKTHSPSTSPRGSR